MFIQRFLIASLLAVVAASVLAILTRRLAVLAVLASHITAITTGVHFIFKGEKLYFKAGSLAPG